MKQCFLIIAVIVVLPVAAHGAGEETELPGTPHCRLDIAIDLEKAKIAGTAEIIAPPGMKLAIYPNGTTILEMLNGGKKIDLYEVGEDDQIFAEASGTIRMVYEVSLDDPDSIAISPEEIVLMHNWYPTIDGLCTYQLRADLPAGFIAVSEGELVSALRRGDREIFIFEFFHPYSDKLTLTASSRFEVFQDASSPVRLYAIFTGKTPTVRRFSWNGRNNTWNNTQP